MNVLQAIHSRRSVRKCRDTAVQESAIRELLEAAVQAPSWNNRQCPRYIVVTEPTVRYRLSRLSEGADGATRNPAENSLRVAPVVIVIYAYPGESGKHHGVEYYAVDVGLAAQNLMLAAAAARLGTCFLGAFNEEGVKDLLDIPAQCRVVCMLPLGHPAKKYSPRTRKRVEEVVSWR